MKFQSLLFLLASHAAALSYPQSTRSVYYSETKHSASALSIPMFAASIAVPSSLGRSCYTLQWSYHVKMSKILLVSFDHKGFIKREYGVSYGYGGAIAASGLLALQSVPPSSTLAIFHAILHITYGIRLCLFLLYRELSIPSFREMRNKIEQKSPKTR